MNALGWQSWGDEGDLFRPHPTAVLNGLADADFNHFMEKVIAKRPGFVSELYAAYAWSGIDFVGRLESLAEDLIRALRMMGTPSDEAWIRSRRRLNESAAPAQPIARDEQLRAEVLKLEYPALVRFGYGDAADAKRAQPGC